MEIISEIGNLHEGSLGVAKSFVMMAKNAGADVVKFQMHLAEAEGIPDEPFRIRFSDQDRNRQDYWRRVNFDETSWVNLAKFCKDKDIEFLCSVFSIEAAKFLEEEKLVRRWKVGSGNATDWPMLDFLITTRKPLIISTGLVSSSEIEKLIEFLKENKALDQTTLLHCVSKYPVSIGELDLHLMDDLRKSGVSVGFSDHSGSIFPSIYAISLGAEIVEVHLTPRKDYFGPDVSSSITPEELEIISGYRDSFAIMKESKGSKEEHFKRVQTLQSIFRKGVYWAENLPPGTRVEMHHLRFLKPVKGIDVVDYQRLLGLTTINAVNKNDPALWRDFGLET